MQMLYQQTFDLSQHRFAELLSLLPTLFDAQVFRLSFDDIQFTDGRNKLRRQ